MPSEHSHNERAAGQFCPKCGEYICARCGSKPAQVKGGFCPDCFKNYLKGGAMNQREPLDFAKLRRANVLRCVSAFKHTLSDWSPAEWGCALAGEVGELCNLLKKLLRGDPVSKDDIADELADVIAYADLLAAALNIDLGEAVRRKFNKVSAKRESAIKL